ncbi:MAG TPA: MarR family transcriptional regulator [Candidatus Dormibacteraeota bacterium]|jgi:DNA-binding MarR family transcriptional regulator|nr:MarR family transcriptional regulator [Candidatus Dormibacteraeota bacterium]
MSSDTSRRVKTADALHSAAIRLLRLVRTEDAQAGIGPAQLSALSVLVFRGEMMLSELASLEQVRPPTMSRIVDGLVQRKLAQRASAPGDRRAVKLTATAEGRKLLLAGKARRVRTLAKRMEGFTKDEMTTLQVAAELLGEL